MRALTLIQPWATAIVHWGKDVENRTWAPPLALLGQRIVVHAGKKFDVGALAQLVGSRMAPDVESVPTGVVLGTVVVRGWLRTSPSGLVLDYAGILHAEALRLANSPWLVPGGVAWALANARELSAPVPCKGAQGLWELPQDVAKLVSEREVARG